MNGGRAKEIRKEVNRALQSKGVDLSDMVHDARVRRAQMRLYRSCKKAWRDTPSDVKKNLAEA